MPKDIVDLYVIAGSLMVPQLKDRALELYFLRFLKDWEAPQDLTSDLYKNTPADSSLRKLHVDIIVGTFGFDNIRDYMEDDPKKFFIDLLEVCRDRQLSPGSCSAFFGITQWIKEKKFRFCELCHEHAKLASYPVFETA